MTYKEIRKNEEVNMYIEKGNEKLGVLGYTDHSARHCALVAEKAAYILTELGYSKKEIELVQIAGYMHDIGNAINRKNHAEYGGLLAREILKNTDMSLQDCAEIAACISSHNEGTGGAFDAVSAALILADKSDVRRNRVRGSKGKANFDTHDRVNYAVKVAKLKVDKEKMVISLNLQIDESICSMFEYFEIFLGRMMMCRQAAGILGARFKLTANGSKVL